MHAAVDSASACRVVREILAWVSMMVSEHICWPWSRLPPSRPACSPIRRRVRQRLSLSLGLARNFPVHGEAEGEKMKLLLRQNSREESNLKRGKTWKRHGFYFWGCSLGLSLFADELTHRVRPRSPMYSKATADSIRLFSGRTKRRSPGRTQPRDMR